jgi:hypothetical protein
MSLIKSADVPKHMADRLRSRRIAARLSGGAAKQVIVPAKGSSPISTPSGPLDAPTAEVLR